MKLKNLLVLATFAAALASCSLNIEPDDSAVGAPQLRVSSLSTDPAAAPALDNIALTVTWSNETAGAANILEISPVTTFDKVYSENFAPGIEKREFTFRELNDILMGQLGMEAGLESPVYLRIIATLNGSTAYSGTAKVTVTPGTIINPARLSCSTTSVALIESKPDRLAISLSWSKNGAGVENAIEMSSEPEFLEPYSEQVGVGVHDRQYTYGQLNDILCNSLGMKADEAANLYVRIVSSYETAAVKSNTLTIEVTPKASVEQSDVKKLYLCGISAADPWNFDDYLVQYNSIDNSYGGVHYVESAWGYKLYPEIDNWDYCYTRSSGDAMSGTLMLGNQNSANMYKPDPGMLYLFDISLGGFKYKLTKVTSASYTGFNDDWSLKKMTQPDPNKPIYTATVTVTKPIKYRWQVVINNDWSLKFCASHGYMLLYDEGDADEEIPNGTYTLTVDLGTCTYTLE